jgi:pyruvate decarboxylase
MLISYSFSFLYHSNELNAAYSADGYARVNEHSIGAVTTTYVSYCHLPVY